MNPDPGGPKTCGSCGSASPTLLFTFSFDVCHFGIADTAEAVELGAAPGQNQH